MERYVCRQLFVSTLLCLGISLQCGPAIALTGSNLHAPNEERSLAVSFGFAQLDTEIWFKHRWGVSLQINYSTTFGSLLGFASAGGTRWQICGKRQGFRCDAYATLGIYVPTREPGLALTTAGTFQISYRWASIILALDFSVPLVFQFLPQTYMRARTMSFFWMLVRSDLMWGGFKFGAGANFETSTIPLVPVLEFMITVGLSFESFLPSPSKAKEVKR